MGNTKNRRIKTEAGAMLTRAAVMLLLIVVCGGIISYILFAYEKTGTIVPTGELFDGKPTVRFVDVGQGSCALITYGGKAVVVDAGTTESRYEAADYIRLYAPSIDYMVITHPHEDHMGGAAEMISRMNVKNLVLRDIDVSDSFYSDALRAAEERGTNVIRVDSPAGFDAGEIHIEILDTFSYEYDDLNDASMVTKVTVGSTSVLMTGDAGADIERILTENNADVLRSDILEVGHHGSNTSTDENFLAAVSPDICIVSCGKNNVYGHPAPITLDRIKRSGAELYRTDRDGTIVLRGEKTDD